MASGKETALDLAYLRDLYPSAVVEKVEYWNHFARRRHDLLGFGDILVVGPEPGFLLVQCTTRKQMSARRSKILGKPQPGDKKPAEYAEYRLRALGAWLSAGGTVEIHGWHQPRGKGTKWEVETWEVTQDELDIRTRENRIPRRTQ